MQMFAIRQETILIFQPPKKKNLKARNCVAGPHHIDEVQALVAPTPTLSILQYEYV
jgi:hypothetical protein